jgi:HEAT repeat protein
MVAFDDENAVVKTLEFEQPTPWLATLLATHPHLWPRAWAVEQLARRAADPAAAAALAAAARSADYFLTRAQAAEALAGFPGGVALPALEVAARDTSAQVREEAVASLGRVGGESALAIVRQAWRADSSDQVRAAALVALARLGGPDARAAILEGLTMPSYRDAIQNAAITLAVQRPDPELVAALGQVIGVQSLPATALAALASRGDTAARTRLRGGLDDERPWVREWVLDAVEEQLDPKPALELLREAQPALTRAEARTAVAQAIGRLERPPS